MAMHRRMSIAALLAATLVSGCAAGQPASSTGSTSQSHASAVNASSSPSATFDPTAFANRVTADAVVGHLQALEQIAKDNSGHRAVGSNGYEAAAQYVENKLRAAGYSPVRDPFGIVNETVVSHSVEVTSPVRRSLDTRPLGFSPAIEPSSKELAVPTGMAGCQIGDYDGVSVTDRIVVVERGSCSFDQKSRIARQAGASALLIINIDKNVLVGTLGESKLEHVPTFGINNETGAWLRERISAGPVRAELSLVKTYTRQDSFNIIADSPGGDPNQVVMVGAHLDGVVAGPAINDNGSGSAAVLETALQLAVMPTAHPTKIRFAWWGAEEVGLRGSSAWVAEQRGATPGLTAVKGYLNFDMIASSNYVIGVYQDSGTLDEVFTDWFNSRSQPWQAADVDGRSDYAPFRNAGIPSGGIFTGADAMKTEDQVAKFGGVAGQPHDANYHKASDTVANASVAALQITVPAIGYATATMANTQH